MHTWALFKFLNVKAKQNISTLIFRFNKLFESDAMWAKIFGS